MPSESLAPCTACNKTDSRSEIEQTSSNKIAVVALDRSSTIGPVANSVDLMPATKPSTSECDSYAQHIGNLYRAHTHSHQIARCISCEGNRTTSDMHMWYPRTVSVWQEPYSKASDPQQFPRILIEESQNIMSLQLTVCRR
ncbi:hypothetical protein CY34DRAFT_680104 [Suillus luteus UH-Slu-Lm8-n1]|uniref:Unplaced genomic scaffold CY34scaffold_72, whole genome shotgun sequence n=1 Tax=Suillus luteus UH-Slu-Lm8-n1 TaxID=930992 RepID=A0A0D0BKQ5_9AGAM|nr:hypothetical protein CY34DRAFT_680104 [Suillus luteus UH-Slu-Lm8-n1]